MSDRSFYDAGMTDSMYQLRPLSADAAASLRRTGGPTYVVDRSPGYPCRACLRDAAIGETVLLTSYTPFGHHSPYRSASPVFVHANNCQIEPSEELPISLTGRQLSVRAFDAAEMMIDAAAIDGANLGDALRALFTNDAVASAHIHNSPRGCWAASAVRSSTEPIGPELG